jgi:asparagine synthase (glutamine-hydrolysing)
MDALPHVNAAMAERAIQGGAQVLLSGNGADELLAVPRYAFTDVAGAHSSRGAWRYLSDMAGAGFGRWGELAGWCSHLLGDGQRSRSYAAATWPQWCHPEASAALRPDWHAEALAWTRGWVASTLDGHQEAHRSWAEADAWDSWWPRAYLPPTSALQEASPFCDAYLASVVWGKPLGWRYDPSERSAYLRVKGQVGRLFPDRVRRLLPSTKRYYTSAVGHVAAATVTVEVAADVALLDADAVAASTCTATRMMAAAVEAWLAGASAAGATI